MMSEHGPKFIIWSEEHGAWWLPGRTGYTTSILKAGLYSFSEAAQITGEANRYLPAESIHEVAIYAPEGKPLGMGLWPREAKNHDEIK